MPIANPGGGDFNLQTMSEHADVSGTAAHNSLYIGRYPVTIGTILYDFSTADEADAFIGDWSYDNALHALVSAQPDYLETSSVYLDVVVPETVGGIGASLSFNVRIDADPDYDNVTCYIGGNRQIAFNYSTEFQGVEVPLYPGHHRITWVFAREAETPAGNNRGIIDDVQLSQVEVPDTDQPFVFRPLKQYASFPRTAYVERGAWAADESYAAYEVVEHNGVKYQVNTTHYSDVSAPPGDPAGWPYQYLCGVNGSPEEGDVVTYVSGTPTWAAP